MRLSLTIAAGTLAAIAGSIIATPGPPHVHASERANPFERDEVDIYSRNNHYHDYQLATEKLDIAIAATDSAIHHAKQARDNGPPHQHPIWENHCAHHESMGHGLRIMREAHSAGTAPHENVGITLLHAHEVAEVAHQLSKLAQKAVIDHQSQKVAYDALLSANVLTRRAIERTQQVINLANRSPVWKNRLAELQIKQAWLEERQRAYWNAANDPGPLTTLDYNSMEVAGDAHKIGRWARWLGRLAQRALTR